MEIPLLFGDFFETDALCYFAAKCAGPLMQIFLDNLVFGDSGARGMLATAVIARKNWRKYK